MQLSEMTWPEVEALPVDLPVVIPIAAVEQHGHHLPLFTDSMLLGEIVRRVDEQMHQAALITPLQWLGNSHHHLDFPGTLSASPRCYLDLLTSLVQNILDHGFRRILLLNGHGGNDVPGKQVMFEMRQRYRKRNDLLLLFATYWSLAEDMSTAPGLYQSEMGHACEWETSMMLVVAPKLVGDYAAVEAVEPGNPFRPASRAWTTKDRSRVGHIGWPSQATADKGEALLQAFAGGVVRMLERMHQWDGVSWEG
ncbi:MAG: creatininase family protein [bacterium]|nr:creatininase family protein [bacterium]